MSDLGNKQVFSENLKYYMKLYNKDRNKLCEDLGFKYSTLRDWAKANTYPRIDKIEMLANYFGIQKSDLIEKKDVIIMEGNTEKVLFEHIMNLAKDKTEQELLVKCTMLTTNNQNKLLELANLYLKEQGDYYIQDSDGKWIESDENKKYYKKEEEKIIKE